jgi:hypothetical protein
VRQLAEHIISILEGYDIEIVGPAISLAYAYVILDLGGHAEDVTALDKMTADLSALAIKYNAAVARPTH